MIRRGIGVQSFVSAGAGTDADAQAFITAAGITDATQQTAINTLVTDLKGYGIWTKMKAIYPMVGGTSSTHKWNLKDPRDLDAAFRLVFSGGWTHSSNGITGNGVNTFAQSFLNDNSVLQLDSAHLSIYSRTNSDGLLCDIGCNMTSDIETNLWAKFSNVFYPRIHKTNAGIANTVSSLGFFISNRISSTEIRAMQTGTLRTITNVSSGKASLNIIIGALQSSFGVDYYSNRQYAFASIGDGLTDIEMTNLTNIVNTYQTSLNRQV